MITVGLLYDAQVLLSRVAAAPSVTPAALTASFNRLQVASFPNVLDVSQRCQWLQVTTGGVLILSDLGRSVCAAGAADVQLRHQIRDVLTHMSPAWSKKIADGRSEAARVMPPDVLQVFTEAGLMARWTDELVEWWDTISLAARTRKNEANLVTGRKAERLSIDYEEARTGRKPQWKCMDSNYAGYDLLSVVDRDNSAPLPIEVKGTTRRPAEASFSITRNEWATAQDNPSYSLHLWIIRDPQVVLRDLRVVSADLLKTHIPTDQGEGQWTTTAIAFSAFW
jgi:hypothetical protein